jgi:hypothetical protein
MFYYDGDAVTLNLGGIPIETGKADDGFLEINQLNPTFSLKGGVDGTQTLQKNNDFSHEVLVKLMQSSPANATLSAIFIAAKKSAGGQLGVIPIGVADTLGTSKFVAAEAIIEGLPNQPFNKEVSSVTWRILVPNPERFVGGNSST